MNLRKFVTTLIVLASSLYGQLAWSHHSAAMFDHEQVRELTGTVKEFQFTNPHTWVQVLVKNEAGEEVEWSLEWGSPNQLGRSGVRPSTLPPGAGITVRINPMLDGSAAGMFIGAKLDDGTMLGRWQD